GETIRQDGAATTALRDPYLADRQLSCRQDTRLEHPLHIPQEAFVCDLLAEHGFQQAVINRAEIVGHLQIDDSLNLLAIQVLMQRPERLMASPARSEAIGTVQEERLYGGFPARGPHPI